MGEQKHNLYVIAGCNGAGKTTASFTVLPEMLDCREFVNADEIAAGLSPFNPEGVAIQAGRLMIERIIHLLKEGETFAFETTLATRSYVKLIKQAQKRGYFVTLLFFSLSSPEQAVKRVAKRVSEGGHNIPLDVIYRRYDNGLSNLFNLYMPVCDYWALYDNSTCPANKIAYGCKDESITIIEPAVYEKFKDQYTEENDNGYLGMICDTPEAYEGQPGFEFLKAVPTTWDQTVVPNASVNEYVTIARKKGEDWFVGTINNSQARSIDVDLKFLDKDKKYKITIYKDAEDTNIDSNKLVKEVKEITNRDKITLPLASDGGSVFHIQPI